MEQQIKRYDNEKKLAKDQKKLAKKGWRVTNVESHKPTSSGCRLIAGGFLFGRKKSILIATYERELQS